MAISFILRCKRYYMAPGVGTTEDLSPVLASVTIQPHLAAEAGAVCDEATRECKGSYPTLLS